MIPLASETVAEIGRLYLVPCMLVQNKGNFDWWVPDDGWVPTLGPRHEDVKHLNFQWEHYHVDWRFIPRKQFDRAHGKVHHAAVLTNTFNGLLGDSKPVLKRRKCHRAMPDFPSVTKDRPQPEPVRMKWQAMERDHACTKLKPGNICPHRGINLTPFIKPDGTVICPGHGLRFNTMTGDLLPHHTEQHGS